jgi:hypothetical protein
MMCQMTAHAYALYWVVHMPRTLAASILSIFTTNASRSTRMSTDQCGVVIELDEWMDGWMANVFRHEMLFDFCACEDI